MVQAIVVPIATDAPSNMVRLISRIPVLGYDFLDDNDNDGRDSTGFSELPAERVAAGQRTPARSVTDETGRRAFQVMEYAWLQSRHMDLKVDGLDQLTPQFIRVIEQAVLKSLQVAGC